MITFTCSSCKKSLEAADDQAGLPFTCTECGFFTMVPIEFQCEGLPSSPEARTITMEELEELRRELRSRPLA